VRLLGTTLQELPVELALPDSGRVAAMREAAKGADAYMTEMEAQSGVSRYPLTLDRMEHAMRLAANRPLDWDADDPRLGRFYEGLQRGCGRRQFDAPFPMVVRQRISLSGNLHPKDICRCPIVSPDFDRCIDILLPQYRSSNASTMAPTVSAWCTDRFITPARYCSSVSRSATVNGILFAPLLAGHSMLRHSIDQDL